MGVEVRRSFAPPTGRAIMIGIVAIGIITAVLQFSNMSSFLSPKRLTSMSAARAERHQVSPDNTIKVIEEGHKFPCIQICDHFLLNYSCLTRKIKNGVCQARLGRSSPLGPGVLVDSQGQMPTVTDVCLPKETGAPNGCVLGPFLGNRLQFPKKTVLGDATAWG